MVNVLPPRRTFGEEFGRNLGGGFDKGFSEGIEKRQQSEELKVSNKALKEYGIDVPAGLKGKDREAFLKEEFKTFGKKKRLENIENRLGLGDQEDYTSSDQTEMPWYERPEGEEKQPWYMQEFTEEPRQKSKGKKKGLADLSDEEIALLRTEEPEVGREASAAKTRKEKKDLEQIKLEAKANTEKRKETLAYRQDLAQRADVAQRDLEAKKESMELINTGKLDHPLVATFLENLPGRMGLSFLSPETVQYKASLVQGYGGLKNLFSGATRVKEIEILENKIADTYLTDEQKIAVINSMARASQQDVIKAEAAQEIEDESGAKPLGILEFRRKVDERTKKKSDAIFNRILDEQNAIFKDAENVKKIPLDFSNEEHRPIIKQIRAEAKLKYPNNTKKRIAEGERIAKEKGYHWK
jgi:hypothetical protein